MPRRKCTHAVDSNREDAFAIAELAGVIGELRVELEGGIMLVDTNNDLRVSKSDLDRMFL